MRRREFLALVAAAWLAARCNGAGRKTDVSPRSLVAATSPRANSARFFRRTRRRGFIEGQNLSIDYRAYTAHVDLTSQYASELVKAQVDVIWQQEISLFALRNRRQKRFRSSRLRTIWSGLDW